jgi:serine/threonine-protein kinase
LETLSGVSTTTAPVVAPPSHRSGVKSLLPWIATAALAVVAAIAWLPFFKKEVPMQDNTVIRFPVPLELRQRSVFNAYGTLAISPDGRSIVYTGVENQEMKIYLRKMDSFESSPIPGTEGGRSPFFSPDGKWLGFFSQHHLKKTRLSGDTPVTLCRIANARGASWGDKGTIVFSPFYYAGLNKISAEGGTPQPLTTVDKSKGERNHRWPFVLPGEKAALFTIGYGKSWSEASIGAVRLDTGERKIVLQGGFGARYLPTGHMVFGRGDALYVIGFDPEKLETYGDPVKLVSEVCDSGAGTLEYAFSQNGILLTLPLGLTYDEGGILTFLNRKGENLPESPPTNIILSDPKLAVDGRLTGFRAFEVWVYDLKRGTSARLTSGSPRTGWPFWTSDGKRVTYASESLNVWNPFWRAADGSDQERAIIPNDSVLVPTSWSPDDKRLLLYRDSQQTDTDVLLYDTADGKLKELVATPASEREGTFSPDGKWMAYSSDESGRNEVYVRSLEGPVGRWQVSTNGGNTPMWKQLNEIFYREGEKVMRVPVQTTPGFSVGSPEVLFEGQYLQMDVSADHQRFIATIPKEKEKQYSLNVVVNWFEEVRQRAPLGKKP